VEGDEVNWGRARKNVPPPPPPSPSPSRRSDDFVVEPDPYELGRHLCAIQSHDIQILGPNHMDWFIRNIGTVWICRRPDCLWTRAWDAHDLRELPVVREPVDFAGAAEGAWTLRVVTR
jgi:hypothetical protein